MMRTVIVSGGNLFALAARELGDATQWILIAQANGLRDPVLSGLTTLRIPDAGQPATGGVAAQ